MPLDGAPSGDAPPGPALLALPAYQQAYVEELYNRLQPQAVVAYGSYFYARTRARWQTQMRAYVEVTGAVDSALPAYERAYVREQYLYLRDGAERAYRSYILERTPWYWQAEMTVLVDVGSPVDLYEYADAVVNDGGVVSPARRTIIQNFISAEKSANVWSKTDDYWCLWGENATQALISLKIGRRASPVGAPVFTANQGYAFNGVDNYLNTLFVPFISGAAMDGNNSRLAVYERTNVAASTYAIGILDSSRAMQILPRTAGGTTAQAACLTNAGGNFTLTSADSRGYSSIQRMGGAATDLKFYKNGVELPKTAEATAVNFIFPAFAIFIGCRNSSGTAANFRASQIGFAAVGEGLTPAQNAAHYANVQAFATAVGANV